MSVNDLPAIMGTVLIVAGLALVYPFASILLMVAQAVNVG
jgi:hypothetical protein